MGLAPVFAIFHYCRLNRFRTNEKNFDGARLVRWGCDTLQAIFDWLSFSLIAADFSSIAIAIARRVDSAGVGECGGRWRAVKP